MRLIYLHGFRSSSRSFKARMLQARLAAAGHAADFLAPDLPVEPDRAIALVETGLKPLPGDTLVGSSLGGCYATWLAERTGCRAVLLNPAVHPARDLASRIGPQTGYHDGEPFQFEARFVEQLRTYEVARITCPERYLLVAAKGDEVLDWREMVAAYPGARHLILPGSDHGLSDFESQVDVVLAFAGIRPVSPDGRGGGARHGQI